jgi:hypothetical protein
VSGYSVRGVAELPGGELAGQMAPACLAVWDASMWGCMCACLLYRLEAWLVAAALTDSMPMLRRLCNLSEYSRQAQREGGECEIERGRERQREGESKLALSAFGKLANTLSLGRSSRCLSGWVAICSIGRAPGCWQGPWPGTAPSRILGWSAGCQPWMHGRSPSRLPICLHATPPSPSVEEPASLYAPLPHNAFR